MVEILSVIAVIAILLAAAAVALRPSGESARVAAKGELVAMLTRARSEAISSGSPVALVLLNLEDGPEERRGKAMTLYAVSQDEVSGRWESGDQLRRWVDLPTRTILLDGRAAPAGGSAGTNVLEEALTITGEVPTDRQGVKQEVECSFVVFGPTGTVLHPSGSGRLEFFIGEGVFRPGGLVVTRKAEDGSAITDRVVVSRLSGRARSVESGVGS